MTPFAVTLVLISALMHAGWNMVLRNQRSTNMFLSMSIVLVVVALAPALLAELIAPSVIVPVWTQIVLGGCCLGIYYLGMTNSYRGGDFTVAYPLARALPVLIVACAELFLGTPPTLVGWIGILLIAGGSVILPLQSFRELHLARYWNRTTLWILLAAFAIAGYTITDSTALRELPKGLGFALRYNVFEAVVAGIVYVLILLVLRENAPLPSRLTEWWLPALAMFFVFGAYTLVLWAFQSDDKASYVIGLRQISIVFGVVAGAYVFRERGARLRIPAAVVITIGVMFVALA